MPVRPPARPPARLPALRATPAESIRYMARPGLAALPSGTLAVAMFVMMQAFVLVIFIWAFWWPFPSSLRDWGFALGGTGILVGLAGFVVGLLVRADRGMVRGIAMAPFIRLTVTDRRILWTLPWMTEPLLEVGLPRVRGALLGEIDRKGRGNAALVLAPGDPAADDHGYIHFDRLPDAAGFVAALGDG